MLSRRVNFSVVLAANEAATLGFFGVERAQTDAGLRPIDFFNFFDFFFVKQALSVVELISDVLCFTPLGTAVGTFHLPGRLFTTEDAP